MEKEKKTKKESEPGPGPLLAVNHLFPPSLICPSPRPHKRWLETALYTVYFLNFNFLFFFSNKSYIYFSFENS